MKARNDAAAKRKKELAALEAEGGEMPEKREIEIPADADADIEGPIKVHLDGDSEDDYALTDIKEAVKKYMAENKDKRIPDEMINEAVRWRLERNDCQNRGYVLDGYPKNFVNAENVFVQKPKAPPKKEVAEGEEAEAVPEDEAALQKPVLQKHIYPDSVIAIHATELFLKRRAKTLSETIQKWSIQRLQNKIEKFRSENSFGN